MPRDYKHSVRKSPLGVEEIIVEDPKMQDQVFGTDETMAITAQSTKGPKIYYRPSTADNPKVQSHERIHAGQLLLDKQLPRDQVASMFNRDEPYPTLSRDDLEDPAYEFHKSWQDVATEPQPKINPKDTLNRSRIYKNLQAEQQDKLNSYLDLANRTNQDNAEPLEASIPESLLRNYVRSYPRRLAAPKVIK